MEKHSISIVAKVYLGCDKEEYRAELNEMVRMFTGYVDIFAIHEEESDNKGEGVLKLEISSDEKEVKIRSAFDTIFSIVMTHISLEKKSLVMNSVSFGDGLDEIRRDKWAYKLALYMFLRNTFDNEMKWGALMGVRPSKLYRQYAKLMGEKKTESMFRDDFFVSEEKLELLKRVYGVQKPMISSIQNKSFDLYVGVPFCKTRCDYCSFAAYSLSGKGAVYESLVEEYVSALEMDIERNLSLILRAGYSLRAVYFGGGTPTSISKNQLERIIYSVKKTCNNLGEECTLEAGRPDTIDSEKLEMIKSFGIDRISINPQTMNDKTLRIIGREHNSAQVIKAYDLARKIGFRTINMDIIIGLEGEGITELEHTLDEIKKLDPENLTVHSLAVKRGARMREKMLGHERKAMGERAESATQIIDMQDVANKYAKNMKMHEYYLYRQKYAGANIENIGYAKEGHESLYNVDIMEEEQNILALGAGAISKWISPGGKIKRLANNKDIRSYIDTLEDMTEKRIALWEGQ